MNQISGLYLYLLQSYGQLFEEMTWHNVRVFSREIDLTEWVSEWVSDGQSELYIEINYEFILLIMNQLNSKYAYSNLF